MTKQSRNRRKAIRRWISMGLITATHYPGGRVKMPFNKARTEASKFFKLKKRTKEEILAIRNPAYEYLIP